MIILSIWLVLAWVMVTLTLWVVMRHLSNLPTTVTCSTFPRLAVLIPARNEASTLATALRSLLAVDYPHLEIILVNDRSEDATGDLMESLAAGDARVKVVHIQQLPPGWLGKTHALHVASQMTQADWLLFTDADVHFEADAFQRALCLAQQYNIDHLCLGPKIVCKSFWEKIFVGFFTVVFFCHYRPDKVHLPGPYHIGIGAFNLIKSSAYHQVGGHFRLALEVVDDMELGRLIKAQGFRQYFAVATTAVQVRWAVGLRGLIQVLEKNAFAGLDYSFVRVFFAVLVVCLASLAPLWLAGHGLWTWACLGYACMIVGGWICSKSMGSPVWTGFFFPLSGILLAFIMLRSCCLCWRQGGIVWRGTLYSLQELQLYRQK